MLITSTVPTILRVPHKGKGASLSGFAIMPGAHEAPDDLDLVRARKLHAFADAERTGAILIAASPGAQVEALAADNDPGGSPDEALALIETETDLDTLREWVGVEKRAKIKRALNARIKALA